MSVPGVTIACRFRVRNSIPRQFHAFEAPHMSGTMHMSGETQEPTMNAQNSKRSVVINGHKTSVSLEEPFWSAIKEIAAAERKTVSELVKFIDQGRSADRAGNLSSAIRLYVLDRYRPQPMRQAA
jgi:predicted DNA-binding ribbon-helix-helix protein